MALLHFAERQPLVSAVSIPLLDVGFVPSVKT